MLFSVPLRRTLILDQKLQFPEGVATAEVLKVGQDPGRGLKALSIAAATGALFKLALSGLRLSPESFAVARYFGERTIGFFGINLSPALLGVGFIVGFNIGCLMLSGGALSWWVFIPFYNNFMIDQNPELAQQLVGLPAADAAYLIWTRQIRYIGVGAMLIGGLWSLWSLRKSLLSGIRTGMNDEGRLGRGRAAHRAGPADEGDPVRHRAVRAAAVRALLRRRRQLRHRARDGRDHGGRGLRVLLGQRLHGGPRRLLEQPGLRHHDLDHPVRLARAARGHGQGLHGRARSPRS